MSAFRYGKTTQEDRLAQAFRDIHIDHIKQGWIVCFCCGKCWRNSTPTQYPHECAACCRPYTQPMQYCMPDLLLDNGTRKAVISVIGSVHEKKRVHLKDLAQKQELERLGFVVFFITNDEIDNLRTMNLRLYCYGIVLALHDPIAYERAKKGEKELPGFANSSH